MQRENAKIWVYGDEDDENNEQGYDESYEDEFDDEERYDRHTYDDDDYDDPSSEYEDDTY